MIRICTAVFAACLAVAAANPESDGTTAAGIRLFEEAYRDWSDFARPVEVFARATTQDLRSAEARYWLGVAYFHRMLHFRHTGNPGQYANQESAAREAAIQEFEKLLEISPDHAEGHALLGTLIGMKIDGGMLRALRYGPSLQKHQSEAYKHGSKNPRVRYLIGVGLFHMADDADGWRKALGELRAAEVLFQREAGQPRTPLGPRWGASSCQTFIGLAHEKLGQHGDAVAAFRRALAAHSNDHLARAGLARLGVSN